MLGYLIPILVSFGLLFGFVGLTALERKRGARFLAKSRAEFDERVTRTFQTLFHIDVPALFTTFFKDGVSRLSHGIAHTLLESVRMLERGLARLVRTLRERSGRIDAGTPKESSRYVRTIAYFKQTLRRSRKTPTPPTESPSDEVG